MIVAVDGPAASGKGTLAKKLAAELNLIHLDTGKLYRYIAWHLQQHRHDNFDTGDFEQYVQNAIDDMDLSALADEALLREEVGKFASKISAVPFVRQQLVPLQRNLAKNIPADKNGLVLDGRDIGTVIFPDADYKFFLTADPDIRAQRRYQELQAKGDTITLQAVSEALQIRDDNDSKRALAPLKPADDAIHLDSTDLSIDEMVAQAKNCINRNDSAK
ncbi:MAG: (d)CMP kinase [Alphaproteobacteria bacterium]|nr:(d)CMP kinase [Alphaproteobacteria bacterium]